jgi:uncharacterized protein YbaP (TraB family)
MQKSFWLFFAVLSWITACRTPEKVVYRPEDIVPVEQSIFWKISGNGIKKPSYLYGTIHMIPKSEYAMPESARAALERIERVAFEIDMKEMTNIFSQLGLVTKAFMKGGKQLKDLLSQEEYVFVKEKIKDRGLPGGMVERLKPMFVMMMLMDNGEGAATDAKRMTSVEMELYQAARKRRIESDGLETMAYQMSIFDSIPYEVQAKMLVQTLRSDTAEADGKSELEKMLELYRTQNIQAMQHMIASEESGMANYEDVLLNQRNHNWIPVMSRMMREKPTMFAVGAGHLGGGEGVIALLRKAGYRVEVVLN